MPPCHRSYLQEQLTGISSFHYNTVQHDVFSPSITAPQIGPLTQHRLYPQNHFSFKIFNTFLPRGSQACLIISSHHVAILLLEKDTQVLRGCNLIASSEPSTLWHSGHGGLKPLSLSGAWVQFKVYLMPCLDLCEWQESGNLLFLRFFYSMASLGCLGIVFSCA